MDPRHPPRAVLVIGWGRRHRFDPAGHQPPLLCLEVPILSANNYRLILDLPGSKHRSQSAPATKNQRRRHRVDLAGHWPSLSHPRLNHHQHPLPPGWPGPKRPPRASPRRMRRRRHIGRPPGHPPQSSAAPRVPHAQEQLDLKHPGPPVRRLHPGRRSLPGQKQHRCLPRGGPPIRSSPNRQPETQPRPAGTGPTGPGS
jgi:hypothetical protein